MSVEASLLRLRPLRLVLIVFEANSFEAVDRTEVFVSSSSFLLMLHSSMHNNNLETDDNSSGAETIDVFLCNLQH